LPGYIRNIKLMLDVSFRSLSHRKHNITTLQRDCCRTNWISSSATIPIIF